MDFSEGAVNKYALERITRRVNKFEWIVRGRNTASTDKVVQGKFDEMTLLDWLEFIYSRDYDCETLRIDATLYGIPEDLVLLLRRSIPGDLGNDLCHKEPAVTVAHVQDASRKMRKQQALNQIAKLVAELETE